MQKLLAFTLVAVLAVAAAGCGSKKKAATTTTTGTTTTQASTFKVGLITDIGGLNDRGFNFLANKGLEDAKAKLGVDGRTVISKAQSDYIPNLTSLAQQQYDIEVANGFLMADAVNAVASKLPKSNFATFVR